MVASCLVAIVVLAVLSSCGKEEPPRPRNVLLLSIDTLRRTALPAYSEAAPELPAIESLCQSSLRFERAHSTASWTLPAHASLMTGLYPDRHGAFHRRTRIADGLPRLAERMREAGLETVAFTGGVWLSPDYGFSEGFDRYDTWVDPEQSWDGPEIPRNGEPSRPDGADLFDRARAYLEGRGERDKGFFLFLHTYSVHGYWAAHPWATRHVGEHPDDDAGYLACVKGQRTCSPEIWARLESLYRAEIHWLDAAMDTLLNTLRTTGQLEETLVVLLSDHGEGFEPQRGRIHHGGRLHEDLIRVPLLISGPGVESGSTDDPVSLVDILPTLSDLFGLEPDPTLDGHSVAPLLRGDRAQGPPRPLFAMEHAYRWRNGRRQTVEEVPEEPLQIAVFRGDDWYVQHRKRTELYDMAADPRQMRNLASTPARVGPLRELIQSREGYRLARPEQELDAKRLEELRSLGYID